MPSIKSLVALAGSQRALRAGFKLLGPANPNDHLEVTVRLRSRNKKKIAVEKIGATPLKRRYLSREEFAATYGAAPADVAKIQAFSRNNKLKLAAVNPIQRTVVLSGSVKAFSNAFQVKLMEYEHPQGNYRGRIGRGMPDVCGDADQIFYGGQPYVVGGTSAVAPLWAGLVARMNQKLGTPVGYFNPLLYSTLSKSGAFHEIVKGNNDTTGQVGGYSAGKGWDACTGWGSPDGAKLLQAFAAGGNP